MRRQREQRASVATRDFRLCVFALARLARDGMLGAAARIAPALAAAVTEAARAAGIDPAAIEAATTRGAAAIVDAEARRICADLATAVRAMQAGDVEAAAAAWRASEAEPA
jgi:hypothetical protein